MTSSSECVYVFFSHVKTPSFMSGLCTFFDHPWTESMALAAGEGQDPLLAVNAS